MGQDSSGPKNRRAEAENPWVAGRMVMWTELDGWGLPELTAPGLPEELRHPGRPQNRSPVYYLGTREALVQDGRDHTRQLAFPTQGKT